MPEENIEEKKDDWLDKLVPKPEPKKLNVHQGPPESTCISCEG